MAGVDAVDRALRILEALRAEPRGQTLAELSRSTGLYKSTILRLAASLERPGYVARHSGTFRLGPAVASLASAYRQGIDPAAEIRTELKKLVALTGETASYYIRDGNSRVCLLRENSPRPLRHHLSEGDRLPLGQGASGLVLSQENKDIKSKGYAMSSGARDPDLAAVAVPLFRENGELRGALAISGPLIRFTQEERQMALSALRESAARLAKLLS